MTTKTYAASQTSRTKSLSNPYYTYTSDTTSSVHTHVSSLIVDSSSDISEINNHISQVQETTKDQKTEGCDSYYSSRTQPQCIGNDCNTESSGGLLYTTGKYDSSLGDMSSETTPIFEAIESSTFTIPTDFTDSKIIPTSTVLSNTDYISTIITSTTSAHISVTPSTESYSSTQSLKSSDSLGANVNGKSSLSTRDLSTVIPTQLSSETSRNPLLKESDNINSLVSTKYISSPSSTTSSLTSNQYILPSEESTKSIDDYYTFEGRGTLTMINFSVFGLTFMAVIIILF
ncbi:hypothetical protein Kpol_358p5 [Vanderwaltozyma polyspora DSM 70294]|uniref:Uncharacterized protein n=1 Tax=Vanderwaltozyma polyspora (strain ATCC 22028 / DSM 70294 / BCRC 21397 / CBS 2163 / NBRC 10782 / NRRL Y-8283 / UCD 57-17) TaxID=436907 RepID=A7TSH2_VANPO|nr:uncharacterized protein Kpol_358p5 [Vanderwaltozyma polyspora DSM 70294]EDO14788.1 hypothetical protein Kpol_358p5 [Vanderwaltozyma polyspora DSM 70294]